MNDKGLSNLLTCLNCPIHGSCGTDRISDCKIHQKKIVNKTSFNFLSLQIAVNNN